MKPYAIICVTFILLQCCLPNGAAADTQAAITLSKGHMEFFARAGAAKLDQDWTWVADGGLRVGLSHRLELAAPLALSFAMLHNRPLELALTIGVTDFWPGDAQYILYTPALVLFVRAHLSHEAAALFALDYTHIQENTRRSPGFARTAFGLMVDMGPYLTWGIGISYQRILWERPLPDSLHRSGLAGRQRVSVGSVRTTPFYELPLFAIHLHEAIDLTIHARLDIDSDTNTTDARFEGGILLHW